jgi:hypothetical protein
MLPVRAPEIPARIAAHVARASKPTAVTIPLALIVTDSTLLRTALTFGSHEFGEVRIVNLADSSRLVAMLLDCLRNDNPLDVEATLL